MQVLLQGRVRNETPRTMPDLRGGGLDIVGAPPGEHDRRALDRQPLGDRKADPLRSADHESNLVHHASHFGTPSSARAQGIHNVYLLSRTHLG